MSQVLPTKTHWGSFLIPLFSEPPLNTGANGDQAAFHVQHWPGCPQLTAAQGSTRFWVTVSHSQMKTRASPPLEGNRAKSKLYPNGSSTSCQKQMGTPKVRDLKAHRQYFSVPREPPGGKPNTPDTPRFPGLTGAPTYLHVVTLPGTQLWARRVLRDGQR